MVTRVTVTLPDDILVQLDEVAHAEGVTRSEVVREAASTYLAGRSRSLQARLRQEAVADGLSWLEAVGTSHAGDGESSLEVLRELRGGRVNDPRHMPHEVGG